jgi:hypothetical protein
VAANFCRDAGGGRAAADHPPASMQVRTRLSPGGRWIRTSSSATNSQRLGSRSTQWCGLDRSDPRTTRGNC